MKLKYLGASFDQTINRFVSGPHYTGRAKDLTALAQVSSPAAVQLMKYRHPHWGVRAQLRLRQVRTTGKQPLQLLGCEDQRSRSCRRHHQYTTALSSATAAVAVLHTAQCGEQCWLVGLLLSCTAAPCKSSHQQISCFTVRECSCKLQWT